MDLFTKFTKVRIKRTSLYTPVAGQDGIGGYINIHEVQIWVNDENIALQGTAFATESESSGQHVNIKDGNLNNYWGNSAEGTGYYIEILRFAYRNIVVTICCCIHRIK